MPDLYFYRNPEDIEKEEQAALAAAAKPEETYPQSDWVSSAPEVQQGASTDWGEQPATATTDWASDPVGGKVEGFGATTATKEDDWGATNYNKTVGWEAEDTKTSTADWGASTTEGDWGA